MSDVAAVHIHEQRLTARIVQGFRAFGNFMTDINQTTVRVTAALTAGVVILSAGMWIGSRSRDVDAISAAQAQGRDSLQQALGRFDSKLEQINSNVNTLVRDLAKLQAHQETADQDRQRLERELRLLRDYTEGRIGHMPYRKD